jgi:hypothetical protein
MFVRSFRHVAEVMSLPRTVITQHPMGRPLGAPGDAERQRTVIATALSALETAERGGTIVDIDEAWRPGSVAT